ncbi:hypothetical protein KAR91_05875 [Candidatus Pacearchaeota archaeon]|nr:hypothetical protein [Candidatus Pacearchaeota archaeon]
MKIIKYRIRHGSGIRKVLNWFVLIAFIVVQVCPFSPSKAHAQSVFNLPIPGKMLTPTSGYSPAVLRGIKIFPDAPLKLEFILDPGGSGLHGEDLEEESGKLIKYFLASLTIPQEDLWVNLSPYEEDRIIPNKFGVTEMGRDLLGQDYLLKQLTASLMYPEDEIGSEFWERVYQKAFEQYGITDIPLNTFNKVWIVPESATVYEHENLAFVVESYLKVMMEEDYLALEMNGMNTTFGLDQVNEDEKENLSAIPTKIIRELIIPEIEKEVNEGRHFASLRQIYNSMILATWYKQNLKASILNNVYTDKNKIEGVLSNDRYIKEKIYQQYLEAFNVGVFDYIKEDYDPVVQQIIPRRYFSGGVTFGKIKDLNITTGNSVLSKIKRLSGLLLISVAFNIIVNFQGNLEAGQLNNEDVDISESISGKTESIKKSIIFYVRDLDPVDSLQEQQRFEYPLDENTDYLRNIIKDLLKSFPELSLNDEDIARASKELKIERSYLGQLKDLQIISKKELMDKLIEIAAFPESLMANPISTDKYINDLTDFQLVSDSHSHLEAVTFQVNKKYLIDSMVQIINQLPDDVTITVRVKNKFLALKFLHQVKKYKIPNYRDRLNFIISDSRLDYARDPMLTMVDPKTGRFTLIPNADGRMNSSYNKVIVNLGLEYLKYDIVENNFFAHQINDLNFNLAGGDVTADPTYAYIGEDSIHYCRYDILGNLVRTQEAAIEAIESVTKKKVIVLKQEYPSDMHNDRYHIPLGRTKYGEHTSLLIDPMAFYKLIDTMTDEEKQKVVRDIKKYLSDNNLDNFMTLDGNLGEKIEKFFSKKGDYTDISYRKRHSLSIIIRYLEDLEEQLTEAGITVIRVPGVAVSFSYLDQNVPFVMTPTNVIMSYPEEADQGRIKPIAIVPNYKIPVIDRAFNKIYEDLGFEVRPVNGILSGSLYAGPRCLAATFGFPVNENVEVVNKGVIEKRRLAKKMVEKIESYLYENPFYKQVSIEFDNYKRSELAIEIINNILSDTDNSVDTIVEDMTSTEDGNKFLVSLARLSTIDQGKNSNEIINILRSYYPKGLLFKAFNSRDTDFLELVVTASILGVDTSRKLIEQFFMTKGSIAASFSNLNLYFKGNCDPADKTILEFYQKTQTDTGVFSDAVDEGSIQTDPAMPVRKGGIDLDPDSLNLKRTGSGANFNIPADFEYFQNIQVDGLTPVIHQIIPITNLPFMLGEP